MAIRSSAHTRTPPRLYLVTPPLMAAETARETLTQLLDSADIAAVLLRLASGDERGLISQIKLIAAAVQAQDRALIVDARADLVARSNADGAHFHALEDFQLARDMLKPDRIAGVSGLTTRHDAMIAAESGADYIMFGEPNESGERPSFESILERVRWWSQIFQVPCVGFAQAPDEVEPLATAGADFIALGDFVFAEPERSVAIVRDAAAALAMEALP